MKSVLITGANGFIGRHVARHFAAHGWSVYGMGRGPWRHGSPSDWGLLSWKNTEISQQSLQEIKHHIDLVVHCAGNAIIQRSYEDPQKDFQDNVASTSTVLNYLLEFSSHSKFIYLSSAAVYGENNGIALAEDSERQPVSPYGVHKRMAEDLCHSYAKNFGLSCMILRLFSVYGVGLERQLLWDACMKLTIGEGTFFGTGEEMRDWFHVEDVAALLVTLSELPSTDCPVFNGGTGVGTTVREIIGQLIQNFDFPVKPIFIRRQQMGQPKNYIASTTRIQESGFHPVRDLSMELKNYVDWFLQKHCPNARLINEWEEPMTVSALQIG